MRYLIFQQVYLDLIEIMDAEGVPYTDLGKYFRFHTFTSDIPLAQMEQLLSRIAGREESIPVVSEQEFLASHDTRTFFFGNQTHIIILE